jgi:lactate permease
MNALLSFLPIVVTIVLMAGFNWSAKKALPLSWLLAALIALVYWKIVILSVTAYFVFGVLKAMDILIINLG